MFGGFVDRIGEVRSFGMFQIVEHGYPWLPALFILGLLLIGLLGWPGTKPTDEASGSTVWLWQIQRGAVAFLLIGFGVSICYLVLAYNTLTPSSFEWLKSQFMKFWLPLTLVTPILGFSIRLFWTRYAITSVSDWWRRQRINVVDESLSDVRKENPVSVNFDPRNYYRDGYFFSGLDAENNPIHIPDEIFNETHKSVIGSTRYGKGVTFQPWLDQAIHRNQTVFFIDPKGDKFLPRVMRDSCKAAGRKFRYVDLNDNGVGGWGPLRSGSTSDRIIRASIILNLIERGSEADHYKVLASSVVNRFFREFTQETTLRSLRGKLRGYASNDDELSALSSPMAKINLMCNRPGLNPKGSGHLNVSESIRNNEVVYIVGAIDDETIKLATRALIVEILQAAKNLQDERDHHLALYVDELRFLISDTVTAQLATAAGRNVSMTFAFQNLGDLLNPDDRSLNGASLKQAVTSNCQVQVYFQPGTDNETAEHISKNSGTVLKQIAYERTEHTSAGAEVWDSGRMMREVEEPLIPVNLVVNLPPRVGIIFRPGSLAQEIRVSPIPVTDMSDVAMNRRQEVSPSSQTDTTGDEIVSLEEA